MDSNTSDSATSDTSAAAVTRAPPSSETVAALDLPKVVRVLRSHVQRDALLQDSHGHVHERAQCFKGRKFLAVLMKEAHAGLRKKMGLQRALKKEEALELGTALLNMERKPFVPGKGKQVVNDFHVAYDASKRSVKEFDLDGFYIWIIPEEGEKTKQYIFLGLFVFGIFAFFTMSAWPIWLRLIVFYLAAALGSVIVGLILIRLAVWLICWIAGYDVWVFPNLFADDLGFFDSFKPFVSGQKNSASLAIRAGVLVIVAIAVYYCYVQQLHLDELLSRSREAIENFAEGKASTDGEEQAADEGKGSSIPSFDELMDELGGDEEFGDEILKEIQDKIAKEEAYEEARRQAEEEGLL